MKKRSLLLLSIFVIAGFGLYLLNSVDEATYQPRDLSTQSQSSYYGAAQFYHMLKADPSTGEINGELYRSMEEKAYTKAINANKANSVLEWEEVGPDNIGGRTRAFLEINDTVLFAGSVSGGLFKSYNKGNTWQRVPSFDKNFVISSMAQLGNGNIYVGTGNTHELVSEYVGSGFVGGGLFVSTDDGETWNYAKDGDGNDIKPDNISTTDEYTYFDRIVADPNQDDKLWVAYNEALKPYIEGQGFGAIPNGLPTGNNAGCEELEVSADGAVILASIGGTGNGSQTFGYLSTDGGENFSLISGIENGLPTGLTRIEFAISPDDVNYMYAAVAVPGRVGKFAGVYASTDKGSTWNSIWDPAIDGDPDPNEQAEYDMAITVVPGNRGSVLVGVLDIWNVGITTKPIPFSGSFGSFFEIGADITFPWPPGADTTTAQDFWVHVDIHEFYWGADGVLYAGTDGGVFRSLYSGYTFRHCNRFYNVTQYYGIGYSANDKVIGGAQDNGTTYITKDRSTIQEAYTVFGGDGFDCEVSSLEPNGDVIFACSQNGNFGRSFDGGTGSGGFFASNEMVGLSAPFHTVLRLWETKNDQNAPPSVNFEADVDYAADEVINYTSSTLNLPLTYTLTEPLMEGDTIVLPDPVQSLFATAYNTTGGVWVTRGALRGGQPDWGKVVNSISGSPTALEFSKSGNILFVGTSSGDVYRVSGFSNAYSVSELSVDSADYALSVSTIFTGGLPISDIAVDPNNDDHLVVSRAGFTPFGGKLFETFNATVPNPGFENIWFETNTELAALPVYSCLIEEGSEDRILAGTEFGLYATENGGESWAFEGADVLGVVPIFDIRQQWRAPEDVENAGYVYVGTHGRGAFKSSTFEKNGIEEFEEQESNEAVAELMVVPNPMTTFGRLEFTSVNEGMVNMYVYSMSGRQVKALQFRMEKGNNTYQFDVSELEQGTYIIQLQKDSKVTTSKFVIL